MIYTLTTNPAIDMNMTTRGIKPQVINRLSDVSYSPNGKGLNVSFVLKHFHVESKIIGFFGGFSGDWIQAQSQKRNIELLPISVAEPTRINVFLSDGKEEYKIINSGSHVSLKKQKEMLALLTSLPDLDYLTINGSLPPGISEDFYDEVLKICGAKQTKVILDISSPKLKELLRFQPFLIKPNEEEIESIFGIIMRDEADITDVLKHLAEKGAQNVLVTLGAQGAYFYNQKNIYYIGSKDVTLISSACAGDAFLGAFLSVWLTRPEELETAMKLSAAIGANVAESYGLGDFAKVESYVSDIKIRLIE